MKVVFKESGETPLECMNKMGIEDPKTYAGRLDPAAEGLLLILSGEECKEKDKYLNLDKEYIVQVLFGISTDTYDLLGIVKEIEQVRDVEIEVSKFIGKFEQLYPPYSSKTVDGKSLFEWAREGVIKEVFHQVEIKEIEILKKFSVSDEEVLGRVNEIISKVKGDFRQKEILESWDVKGYFPVIELRVVCSSGTYMRQLANELANVPSLAYKITRTRVGDFRL